MTRIQVDCINSAVQAVKAKFPKPELIAWYGTGTGDIRWTAADRALFPDSMQVEIDQGYGGTPIPGATVRDVESGAWAPGAAVDLTGWTAERPTIYCDRSTLPMVIGDGWKGDVWLAWPGWTGQAAPVYSGVTVVAVQNVVTSDYDTSLVFDRYWPSKPPPVTAPGYPSVTVTSRSADVSWPHVPNAGHYVIEYQASGIAKSVLVDRVPAPSTPGVMHAKDLMIPGASGGILHFYGIVNGQAVNIGSRVLP
jgi:hypothetical protein